MIIIAISYQRFFYNKNSKLMKNEILTYFVRMIKKLELKKYEANHFSKKVSPSHRMTSMTSKFLNLTFEHSLYK
jgi:hypothetical protein